MMKIKFLIVFFLFLSFSASAQKNNGQVPRPKLVVGLVVDQMRWDYLYRYFNRYEANGFKRLLNEGFSCDNTMIDYLPTVTAIGHASIYTGSVPSIHGIAGNDFIIQATGKRMYCTEDTAATTLGSTSKAGQMSPRNLLTSTITDELKLATNFESKVIGIALKDRGSILPAGHAADAAYWFDDQSGNWISSTWYMNELPAWVNEFNDRKLPEHYLQKDWNTLFPLSSYNQSTADNTPYERHLKGASGPTLPVQTSILYKDTGVGIIRHTPSGNTFTLDFAKEAIRQEKLGQDNVTDFLAISLSSTDHIGHMYGPNSIEIEDTYLRLDKDLADFLEHLDKTVGKGQFTFFLTSDHGAAHNPKYLTDKKMPAGYWSGTAILKQLNTLLKQQFKNENLVLAFTNYQVHLNMPVIKASKLNLDQINEACIKFLEKQEGIANVFSINNKQSALVHEVILNRLLNGHHTERSGIIKIIIKPGWYTAPQNAGGTTHGTWNPYDAHIPLVWMGWGVNKGKTNKPTYITEIAPTIAALLKIQMPNGCIGQPITEVLE